MVQHLGFVYSQLRQFGLVVCLGVIGCEGTFDESVSTDVIDSAGVQVVKFNWKEGLASADTVDLRSPTLRIGVIAGDPDYEFHKIAAVVPFGHRGLAVVDGGRHDIRLFDWLGRHVVSFGRRGDGPSELGFIGAAFEYRGDSIAVSSFPPERVSVFSIRGGRPRVVALTADPETSSFRIIGAFRDGRLIGIREEESGPMREGLTRRSMTVMMFSPKGEPLSAIGTFPGEAFFTYRSSGGSWVTLEAPFSVSSFVRVTRSRVVVADDANSRVVSYGLYGELLERWTSTEPRLRLSQVQMDLHRDSSSKFAFSDSWVDAVRAMPYPEFIPFFIDMMADPKGGFWLLRERWNGTDATWVVVDRYGRVAGFVRSPRGVVLSRVTEEHLLAVATDSLGVQYVEVYDRPFRRK